MTQEQLFDYSGGASSDDQENDDDAPLADRMRPGGLEDVVGQQELIGSGKPLRQLIESGSASSIILWGPPGSGKTTIARIMAEKTSEEFVPFSAVTTGIKQVRQAISRAETRRKRQGRGTLLFVDEIHRFNKAQQDAFLPHVESGRIRLIGATTENPSFELISPLLSRCRVFSLSPLSEEDLQNVIQRALDDTERGLGDYPLEVSDKAKKLIIRASGGDAREALNILESSVEMILPEDLHEQPEALENQSWSLDRSDVEGLLQSRTVAYDKEGEKHYNLLSAFHKSLRGSDPDAAIYWMSRMLEGGEDPLTIARRMVVMAAEDVGMADPQALQVAVNAKEAFEFLGSPEGEIPLAEAAIYLAEAPKDKTAYWALKSAKQEVKKGGNPSVPLHLRNAVTDLMDKKGYGEGYVSPHTKTDEEEEPPYLPEELEGKTFYQSNESGN